MPMRAREITLKDGSIIRDCDVYILDRFIVFDISDSNQVWYNLDLIAKIEAIVPAQRQTT